MQVLPETIAKIMWKGRPSWLYSDGTILPVICGGDGSTEGGDGGDDGDGANGDGGDDSDKKFTQADLNRLLAREKSDGKRVAMAEALSALGVKDIDEAKGIITRVKDAEQKNLSDAEKAKNEAIAARQSADDEKALAAREKLQAMKERALIRAKIEDDQINLVSKLVEVDDGADQDAVNAAVEDLKKAMPQLFAPAEDKQDPKPPGGNPGRQPRKGNQTATPKDAALAVLHQRHPKTVKTS